MNNDQLNSLIRSVLKIAGAIAVAHGATKAAAIINSEDVIGVIVILAGALQSYRFHGGKSETVTTTEDLKDIIAAFAAGPQPPLGAVPHADALSRLEATLAAEPTALHQPTAAPAPNLDGGGRSTLRSNATGDGQSAATPPPAAPPTNTAGVIIPKPEPPANPS